MVMVDIFWPKIYLDGKMKTINSLLFKKGKDQHISDTSKEFRVFLLQQLTDTQVVLRILKWS